MFVCQCGECVRICVGVCVFTHVVYVCSMCEGCLYTHMNVGECVRICGICFSGCVGCVYTPMNVEESVRICVNACVYMCSVFVVLCGMCVHSHKCVCLGWTCGLATCLAVPDSSTPITE